MAVEPEKGGLHAFVFIDRSDQDITSVIDRLATHRKGSPRVLWAGSVVGDYVALAHLWHADEDALGAMQDFIDTTLWNEGVRCHRAIQLAFVKQVVKIHTPAVIALVGIKADHGRATSVLGQLEAHDQALGGTWMIGASLLSGHLDILLQLNAETLSGARRLLLGDDIASIEGIAWTSTAIADGRRGAFAKTVKQAS